MILQNRSHALWAWRKQDTFSKQENVGKTISASRWWGFKGLVALVWIIFTTEWTVFLVHPVINVVTILVTHWALVSDGGRVTCMEVHPCYQSWNWNLPQHFIFASNSEFRKPSGSQLFFFQPIQKSKLKKDRNKMWNSSSCCSPAVGLCIGSW